LGTIITCRSDFADRKGLIENSHRWDLAQVGESEKLFFIMLLSVLYHAALLLSYWR
jgi:hypothetical protein